MAVINKIGGDNVDQVSWMTDLSMGIIRVALKHGCVPARQRQGAGGGLNLPDPVPIHREPLYTPGAIWWRSTPRWTTAATSA